MKLVSPNHKTKREGYSYNIWLNHGSLCHRILQIVAAQTDQREILLRLFNAKISLLAREVLEPQFTRSVEKAF